MKACEYYEGEEALDIRTVRGVEGIVWARVVVVTQSPVAQVGCFVLQLFAQDCGSAAGILVQNLESSCSRSI